MDTFKKYYVYFLVAYSLVVSCVLGVIVFQSSKSETIKAKQETVALLKKDVDDVRHESAVMRSEAVKYDDLSYKADADLATNNGFVDYQRAYFAKKIAFEHELGLRLNLEHEIVVTTNFYEHKLDLEDEKLKEARANGAKAVIIVGGLGIAIGVVGGILIAGAVKK